MRQANEHGYSNEYADYEHDKSDQQDDYEYDNSDEYAGFVHG